MTTVSKHMLLAAISQHANYSEKQLVQSGQLAACADRIVNRLRKTVRLHHRLFLFMLVFPVALQMAAWAFSSQPPSMWRFIVLGCLIAMSQLPTMIMQHLALSKLETILAMWLCTDSDETDLPMSPEKVQLAESVASSR